MKQDNLQSNIMPMQINNEVWREKFDDELRKIVALYFHKLTQGSINQEQMRINISKDLLSIFVSGENFDKMSTLNCIQIIQNYENLLYQNIIYLSKMFPRNQKLQVSQQMDSIFQNFDQSDEIGADMLARLKFIFDISDEINKPQRTQILQQLQNLLNKLIRSSKIFFPLFDELFHETIPSMLDKQNQLLYRETAHDSFKFKVNTKIPDDHPEIYNFSKGKLKLPSIQIFRILVKWMNSLDQIVEEPEKVLTNRKFLKKIAKTQNRQLSKSPSKFLRQSCFSKIFSPNKNSQKPSKNIFKSTTSHNKELNIVSEIFEMGNENTQGFNHGYQFENYRFKITGSPINQFISQLLLINKNNQAQQFSRAKIKQLKQKYSRIMKVVSQNKITGKYSFLQKKLYALSQGTYKVMEQIVIQRLIYLLTRLVKFRKNGYKLNEMSETLRNIDFIQFKVNDLFRAKIMGNQSFLISIFQIIQKLHGKGQISIIKIKNRLQMPLCDVMVIFALKNCPINCELQLVLTRNTEDSIMKMKAQQSIHHFIYEIKRAVYGPISQMSIIVATKDHRKDYLEQIKKIGYDSASLRCNCGKYTFRFSPNYNYVLYGIRIKQLVQIKDSQRIKKNSINIQAYYNLLHQTFVCSVCEQVFQKGEDIFPILQCIDCGYAICSECQFTSDKQAQKAFYRQLLEGLLQLAQEDIYCQFQIQGQRSLEFSKSRFIRIPLSSQIVRAGRTIKPAFFWEAARKILEKLKYQLQAQNKHNLCILIRSQEITSENQIPYVFMQYSYETKKFSRFNLRKTQDLNHARLVSEQFDQKLLEVQEFDALILIKHSIDHFHEDISFILHAFEQIMTYSAFSLRKPIKTQVSDEIEIIRKIWPLKSYQSKQLQVYNKKIKQINFDRIFNFSQFASQKIKNNIKFLKFINLNKNCLQSLRDLSQLTYLEDLRVSFNSLNSLKIDQKHFVSLKVLEADQNYITELKVNNHPHLKILSVKKNSFEIIQIKKTPKITTLFLSRLQYYKKTTYTCLQKIPLLKSFYWADMNISNKSLVNIFEASLFDSLEIINSNFPVAQFPQRIDYMNIQNNSTLIKLDPQQQIRKICLKNVKLERITLPQWSQEVQFVQIQLQDKNVKKMQAPNLKRLKISIKGPKDFQLQTIALFPSFFQSNFDSLQYLELSNFSQENKKQTKLSNFSNFQKLKQLIIKNSFQSLTNLPQSLKNIRVNSFQARQSDFRKRIDCCTILHCDLLQRKLQNIALNRVLLKYFHIPETCRTLTLKNNELQEIYAPYHNFLEKLTISNNKSIDKASIEAINANILVQLQLNNINIRTLNLLNFKNLNILDMKNNKITQITWINPKLLPNLQKLVVSENRIQNLEIGNFSKLRYVLASKNPLILSNLSQYFEQNSNNLQDLFLKIQTLSIYPIIIEGQLVSSLDLPNRLKFTLDQTVSKHFINFKEIK